MEQPGTVNLCITFLEKEGPFLKIWGQTEKNGSLHVEHFLHSASPQFEMGVGRLSPDVLLPGVLMAAKYKDGKYYRARVTNIAYIREGYVEVNFIDTGCRDVVSLDDVRSLAQFPPTFIAIPPLATGFIFAEAHCPGGGEWNDAIFDSIVKELRYREVQCHVLIQAANYYLVKLSLEGADLNTLLIQRRLMQPIPIQAQQAVLLSMSIQRQQQQHTTAMQQQQVAALQQPQQQGIVANPGLNTYKACTLEPSCLYPVYVAYVNDGPCHFSVQLKQSEEVLVKLMSDINTMTLKALDDTALPGTICLAKCHEDGNICRAVVTNEVDNQFKVFYVDFGNYEVVPLDSLYQIPFKFVIPKVMAIRLCLAGVEKSTVTMEMQFAFKKFVDNRLLHLKVLPAQTRMAVPKCELWDPETKTSALDVVNRAARHSYPDPISLTRGFSQEIKVSFVYGCSRFYVQLSSKEEELIKLMKELQELCQSSEPMNVGTIKVGLPCCALYEGDDQWYRAEIVEIVEDKVKVRYIDFGNEEVVAASLLREIEGEQLTVLRPQAIECALNGYQNMGADEKRDDLLNEIILETTFTMKVVDMLDKKALVELFDLENYNVASLLLDKFAAATSQISPLLAVQGGNILEHRKSNHYQQEKSDRPRNEEFKRPSRENNDWGETNKERSDRPWRQDRQESPREFRNKNSYDNDTRDRPDSWRQNNKGFSPKRHNKFNDTENNWEENDSSNAGGDTWENNQPAKRSQENDGYRKGGGYHDRNKSENNFDRERPAGRPREGGGYRKRDDDSSNSEQSYNARPPRNDRGDRGERKFPNKSYDRQQTSYNSAPALPPIDAAPVYTTFTSYEVLGTEAKITISWFYNPGHFYLQLTDSQEQFKTLMEDIQTFYKNRPTESTVVGAPIVSLFPEDNVLYRAQVLEVLGSQYKVLYVDFGNVTTVSKIWRIDKKFMELPAQAILCGLAGIAPLDGKEWGNVDGFGSYFDKDGYTCRFFDKDETKTYVDLLYGSDAIAQLLINDGAAVAVAVAGIAEVEIPILLGQQFRATVKSVNNLTDIIIALECGLAINCSMHNVETATETFEEELKGLVEQAVIVYVDNIVGDGLEVTLYDTLGNKLVILNPDEGAYDTVEPVCPCLVHSSTVRGFVSHADETSIYLQPAEFVDGIASLLDRLFECYDAQTVESTIIPEEEQLYAVKSVDGNWYRGRVKEFNDEKVTVNYVDYGNTEEVEFGSLRELAEEFHQPCVQCVKVAVSPDASTFLDKEVIATVYYGEAGWEGTIEPSESAPQAPEVEADLSTIHSEATESPRVVPEANGPEVEPSEAAQVPTDGRIQVFVSHIDSPNEFYLQLQGSTDAIEEFQSVLQTGIDTMPVMENPSVGMLCAAPYTVDQQWYRAEILDADDDITTVRFIDFGNTDVIDNRATKIKTLPADMLSMAVYATKCSLNIRPRDSEWEPSAVEFVETLTSAENVEAEFLSQDEKINYVDLYLEGTSVAEKLIADGVAVPFEQTETGSTGFVSHLNSPSEFWVQMESCVDELEWIAERLSTAETFDELEDLTPGTLCAALFPEDQMWYRARILSNTVAGIELLFIDYGNSCTGTSLRQLAEDLLIIAPMALKCALRKPEGIPTWSPEAAAKFVELSADGQTIFSIRKLANGETTVVELAVNGEDVTAMLSPVTVDGCVKNVESLERFTVEKDGEVIEGSFKLESLPGSSWNEDCLEVFKEINQDGSTLFQIEFVNDTVVRLYLNGHDIRPRLSSSSAQPVQKVEENATPENTQPDEYTDETIKATDVKPEEEEVEPRLDEEAAEVPVPSEIPTEPESTEDQPPSELNIAEDIVPSDVPEASKPEETEDEVIASLEESKPEVSTHDQPPSELNNAKDIVPSDAPEASKPEETKDEVIASLEESKPEKVSSHDQPPSELNNAEDIVPSDAPEASKPEETEDEVIASPEESKPEKVEIDDIVPVATEDKPEETETLSSNRLSNNETNTTPDDPRPEKVASRPSSRLSNDEMIVPAAISRPETPDKPEETENRPPSRLSNNETIITPDDPKPEKVASRPSSRLSNDEMIVPAAISRPETPDKPEETENRPPSRLSNKELEVESRPHSRLSNDEKIVSGAISTSEEDKPESPSVKSDANNISRPDSPVEEAKPEKVSSLPPSRLSNNKKIVSGAISTSEKDKPKSHKKTLSKPDSPLEKVKPKKVSSQPPSKLSSDKKIAPGAISTSEKNKPVSHSVISDKKKLSKLDSPLEKTKSKKVSSQPPSKLSSDKKVDSGAISTSEKDKRVLSAVNSHEKILSRPDSPLEKAKPEKVSSRPASRLSFDETVVPGAMSSSDGPVPASESKE